MLAPDTHHTCHRCLVNAGNAEPSYSSRGPRLAKKLLSYIHPPYMFFFFFFLSSIFNFIRFHHFSTFLSVHLIRFVSSFFQNFRHPFLLPPRLIHFTNYLSKCHFLNLLTSSISKKINLQNILQNIFVIKNIFELSKNDLSISRTKNRTATTSLPSFVSSLLSYIFLGVVSLVGFYLQYIKRYTYSIIITYKGINVIIIVWLRIMG